MSVNESNQTLISQNLLADTRPNSIGLDINDVSLRFLEKSKTNTQCEPLKPANPIQIDEYETMSSKKRNNIFLLFLLGNFTFGALVSSIFALFPAEVEKNGYPVIFVLIVLTGNGLGGITGSFTFQLIIRCIPRKLVFVLSYILFGTATIIFGAANDHNLMTNSKLLFQITCFLMLFLIGFSRFTSNNITVSSISYMFKDSIPKKVSQNLGIFAIGAMIGPIYMNYLILNVSNVVAYSTLGILFFILALVFGLIFPHTPTPKSESSQLSIFRIIKFKKNTLGILTIMWICIFNSSASSVASYYFIHRLGINITLIPYYCDLVSCGLLLMAVANGFLTKIFDNRFVLVVFGLFTEFIGGFMVGPVLPNVTRYDHFWVSIFGYFIFQMAIVASMPTTIAEIIKELKIHLGQEVTLATRDKVTTITGFCGISASFFGPLISILLLLFMDISVMLACLGCGSLLVAFVYIFVSGLYKESIFVKKKKIEAEAQAQQ